MVVRSRSLLIRLMDKSAVSEKRMRIQFMNIAAPVMVTLLFGLIFGMVRKKKYSGK